MRRRKPERRGCGHTRHVGTCAVCQRRQLDRWRQQLAEATRLSHR